MKLGEIEIEAQKMHHATPPACTLLKNGKQLGSKNNFYYYLLDAAS